MPDPFNVLGIPATASLSEARVTFRRLAHMYHPDRYVDAPPGVRNEAERRMRDISQAFTEISVRLRGAAKADLTGADEFLNGWWNAWERRRAEDEARAARHRRWEEIEHRRLAREELERTQAEELWRRTYGEEEKEPPLSLPPARPRTLNERIKEAKRLEVDPDRRVTIMLDEPSDA